MKRLRKLLRSQRGDMLIDSMFGAVIIALVMASAGTVLMAATQATDGNDRRTSRGILLNTVLSDEKPNLATYSATPITITRTSNGQNLSVTLWRDEPAPGVSVLNAAVQRPTRDAEEADCSGADRLDPSKCMTSKTFVTTSSSGVDIKTVTLNPGTAGALNDFTTPTGATELRYIFKVTDAPVDSTLTFGNRDHANVRHAVKIPAGQSGYYYGRILVNAGARLFIESPGPAAVDPASIMIYEAPK